MDIRFQQSILNCIRENHISFKTYQKDLQMDRRSFRIIDHLSMDINMKIIKLKPVLKVRTNKTGINFMFIILIK